MFFQQALPFEDEQHILCFEIPELNIPLEDLV